jgi:hypothetical protein
VAFVTMNVTKPPTSRRTSSRGMRYSMPCGYPAPVRGETTAGDPGFGLPAGGEALPQHGIRVKGDPRWQAASKARRSPSSRPRASSRSS